MGAFSKEMRKVAKDLMKELGNPCVLVKVEVGAYDPLTGRTVKDTQTFNTFSAPYKHVSVLFGSDGINTNLSGFNDNKVTVPWVGYPIDTAWTYDGQDITKVEAVESQGDVIIYTITLSED